MCGRFVMSKSTGDLVAAFRIDEVLGDDVRASWNVAPTQRIRVVTERADRNGELERWLETVRWGLVPVWAKDPKAGFRLINARMETVTEKPSFRSAAVKRRGLVPAYPVSHWSIVLMNRKIWITLVVLVAIGLVVGLSMGWDVAVGAIAGTGAGIGAWLGIRAGNKSAGKTDEYRNQWLGGHGSKSNSGSE